MSRMSRPYRPDEAAAALTESVRREQTREQAAMMAATVAVRRVLAQSKNPRTTLGRMDPTGVAYHAALAAIEAHRTALGGQS